MFIFFLIHFVSNVVFSDTVQSLLQGLEYRKNIIQTGIIGYSYFHYDADNIDFLLQKTFKRDDLSLVSDYVLTLSGNNWSESDRNGVVRYLRDDKYKYTFLDTGLNDDDSISHSLEIQPADYTFEEHAKLHPDFRVVQGGTVPWAGLLEYFIRRQHEVRHETGVTIATGQNIEKCEQLELTIPQENYSVLSTAGNLIANSPYMKVRIYILPDKGYVIRRLEYMTADGKFWGHRFESTDFREISAGIWLPMNYKIIFDQDTGQGKNKYKVWEYSVKNVSRINEPILGKDFDLRVPQGTTVYDETGRGGSLTKFTAGVDITLENIDNLVQDAVKLKESQIRKPVAAVTNYDFIFRVVFFGLGCFSLVIAYWLASRKKVADENEQ
ncbi:MAG: hypothetical protein LBC74_15860 [Planctomycetaceae bacterium]|nr:hypothetical protein [Planctomycetaceae bacterium]